MFHPGNTTETEPANRLNDDNDLSLVDDLLVINSSDSNSLLANDEDNDDNDIRNQVVRNRFSYDVSLFFSDAYDDELTFSATGLPEDVAISTGGIISGQANRVNRGKWILWVTANDGNGGTVTGGFQLKIN